MHEVLVNPLGGLSLPRKSVVRLTDRPDMTLDVYHGRKTTMQQQQQLVLDLRKVLRAKFLSLKPDMSTRIISLVSVPSLAASTFIGYIF